MVLILSALSSLALAQTPETASSPRVVVPPVQLLDFDPQSVTGTFTRPESNLILERKRATFDVLIRLRTDFDAEMVETLDEVR
jgi:hypothetical protein